MAAVLGVRQQRVQFFYDTDFAVVGAVTTGNDLAQSEKQLFANAQPGNSVRTNMPSPGFLAGDQTFLTFAVRHEINFWGGVTSSAGSSALPLTTATVSIMTINFSTFQFVVGDKPEFEGPVSMTPAGGGPWGFISDSAQVLITNGEPQTKAIYVLPLPIAIAKRQQIRVVEKKPSSVTTGYNFLDAINNYTGARLFRCYLDGFNTRDVQ